MKSIVGLIFASFALCGCASVQSAYEPPVVDMRSVDQQKYANDLGECTDAKRRDGSDIS
jgi:hypothetical protein